MTLFHKYEITFDYLCKVVIQSHEVMMIDFYKVKTHALTQA